MQQQVKFLVVAGGEQGLGGLGPGGLFGQASQPRGVEGGNGVAYRASGAAQIRGNEPGPLAGGAGQEDLATAQGEGIGRTQAGLQLLPLGGSQRAEKEWWMHTPLWDCALTRTRPLSNLH